MQSKALMMRGPAQLLMRMKVEKRVFIVEKNHSPVKQENHLTGLSNSREDACQTHTGPVPSLIQMSIKGAHLEQALSLVLDFTLLRF